MGGFGWGEGGRPGTETKGLTWATQGVSPTAGLCGYMSPVAKDALHLIVHALHLFWL
jgi:hypothetical protein